MGSGGELVRVFVIDDQQLLLDGIVGAFTAEPDIVVAGTAGTVAGAVSAVGAADPTVIVLDDRLPDGDGASAAPALLEAAPGAAILLLLTSAEDARTMRRAVDAGCTGFLTRDRAATELVDAVRSLADGDAYVPGDLLGRLLPAPGPEVRSVGHDLTEREVEVLGLASTGLTNQGIADALAVSVNTVRNHVQHAMTKLGAHSKLEAVSIALRAHLIRFPD